VEGGWIRIRFEDVCLLAGRGANFYRKIDKISFNISHKNQIKKYKRRKV
jgi:hypothetical protein